MDELFLPEDWGIAQNMQRILAEIRIHLKESLDQIDYYSTQRMPMPKETSIQLQGKDTSINTRLESYSKLYSYYLGGKQLNFLIYQFLKDKTLINNIVPKIYIKDQTIPMLDQPMNYEQEIVFDPKLKIDSQPLIIYLRPKNQKWFFIRIIRYSEQSKQLAPFYLLEIQSFLCKPDQEMKNAPQVHTQKIMELLNQWFKKLFFNSQNKKQNGKFFKDIIQYIEESMILLFQYQKCAKCNQLFKNFIPPYIKFDDDNRLYHQTCLE